MNPGASPEPLRLGDLIRLQLACALAALLVLPSALGTYASKTWMLLGLLALALEFCGIVLAVTDLYLGARARFSVAARLTLVGAPGFVVAAFFPGVLMLLGLATVATCGISAGIIHAVQMRRRSQLWAWTPLAVFLVSGFSALVWFWGMVSMLASLFDH